MTTPILLLALEEGRLSEQHLTRLQELAPGYEVIQSRGETEIQALIDRIEIVVGDIPWELLGKASRLRWVQLWGAGADWLMRYPEAARHPFILTNASGVHPIPISEHIFALLLALARRLPQAFRAQQAHRWESPDWDEVFELAGKTLVLVGVGAIGERTAQVAQALGMAVVGVRRDPTRPAAGVERMISPDQLLDVLPEADFVVITAPLTPETRGLIGREALRAMKPTACIVNIGRGAIIQEETLIQALQEGWIRGAGLDVVATEPLPADSPLWDMENVIITAHYAGKTPCYDERAFAILEDNLWRFLAGQPLRNVVDKQAGY